MIDFKKVGKFFIGSGIGALLDFAVGVLLVFYGFSVSVSAVIGFATAILLTYCIHLRWTFNIKNSSFVSAYLIKFVIGSIVTLLTRLLVIYLGISLFTIESMGGKNLFIALSIGISFCLNYVLSTFWSFSIAKNYK